MKATQELKRLYAIGALVFIFWATSLYGFNSLSLGLQGYSLALLGTALVTFFGLLRFRQYSQVDERSMRSAIAASLIVTYLALVSIVAFRTKAPEPMPDITETMITHFTTIVGIVIAFYFGASAYTEAGKRHSEDKTAGDTKHGQDS